MTYKIQIGDARLSGSVVFEGDLEALSSPLTGANLSLADATSLAGDGLSDSSGRLRGAAGGITNSMISGTIPTSKLTNSSMNIAGITSTLGGSEPTATAVAAAIDSEPMAITNLQDLDVFAAGDLTMFSSISASLTIGTSSTSVSIPGHLTTRGDVSLVDSEFLTSDNYININSNYTSDTAISGGLVMVTEASQLFSGDFYLYRDASFFLFQEVTASSTLIASYNTGDLVYVRDFDFPENTGFYEIDTYGLVGAGPDTGKNRWNLVRSVSGLAPEVADIARTNWVTLDSPTQIHNITFYIAKVYIIRNNESNDGLALTIGSNESSYVTEQFNTSIASGLSGSYLLGNASNVVSTSPHTIATTDTMTLVDSSGGTVLLRMPAITSSSVGNIYTIKDYAGSADVNGITIQDNNYSDIDGNNSIIIESSYGAAKLVAYSGSSGYGYRIL